MMRSKQRKVSYNNTLLLHLANLWEIIPVINLWVNTGLFDKVPVYSIKIKLKLRYKFGHVHKYMGMK